MTTQHDITAISIAMQTRTPVFLWSTPGMGKTSVLEALARALGEKLWTVILSIREPQDLGGLPVITKDGVVLHPPRWAREVAENDGGVVFFDEFNAAQPMTQSAALRVIYGGYAGDQKLPSDNIAFVMAGNSTKDSQGVFDLTSGIANRIIHFDFRPDMNEWREGMCSGWSDPQVRRLPKGWESGHAAKRGLVAAFIGVRPALLDAMPQDTVAQGGAWPSRRTWDYAARLLAACDALGLGPRSTEARLLVQGAVGDGACSEFMQWLVSLDLPDPEAVLANPLKIDLPQRQDQIMALLDSVTAAAIDRGRGDKQREARYYAAWKFIGRLTEEDRPDLTLPAARTLARNLPPGADRNLPPESKSLLPMLRKANINFSRDT